MGNPNPTNPRRPSRRKAFVDSHKGINKDRKAGSEMRRVARCERLVERYQAELGRLQASDSEAEEEEEDYDYGSVWEKRITIKFFWKTAGKLTSPAHWDGRDGLIAHIRRRMGSTAPEVRTVRKTLERIVADPADDLLSNLPRNSTREFGDEEDMFVGLLICEGHSQRSATFLINGERIANGLEPLTRHVIRDAEKRVELERRARRKEKSGSSDLNSAWSLASLESCRLC